MSGRLCVCMRVRTMVLLPLTLVPTVEIFLSTSIFIVSKSICL